MSLLPDELQSNAAQSDPAPTPSPAPPAPSAAQTPAAPPAPKKTPSEAVSGAFSSLRVSLMPSDLEGAEGPDLGRRLLIFALVFVAETAVLGVLYIFTSQAVTAATVKRDTVLAQIDKADQNVAAKAVTVTAAAEYAYQAAAAKTTLDGHLYWSNFFTFLEQRTRPGVVYNNFSGDAGSGTFTVEAEARSYHDAAEQIVALREDPLVVSVLSTSAAAKIDDKGQVVAVSFTLIVRCKPDVWQATSGAIQPASAAPAAAPSTGTTPSNPALGTAPSNGSSTTPNTAAPVVIPPPAPASGTNATGTGQAPSNLFPTTGSTQPPASGTPSTP